MITLTFACGHSLTVGDADTSVRCACGEPRVQAVKARAPKFRGVVLGPHAQFEYLTGVPVTVGVPDGQ